MGFEILENGGGEPSGSEGELVTIEVLELVSSTHTASAGTDTVTMVRVGKTGMITGRGSGVSSVEWKAAECD